MKEAPQKAMLSMELEEDNNSNSIEVSEKPPEIEKNATKGLVFCISAMVLYTLVAFEIKTMQVIYKEKFNLQLLLACRSFSLFVLSYFKLRKQNRSLNEIRMFSSVCKKWLFIRSFGNYIGFALLISSYHYIRIATATVFSSTHPVVVLILSSFILQERFYLRYAVGFVICIVGSFLIVQNEYHSTKERIKQVDEGASHSKLNPVLGCALALLHTLILGLTQLSHKKLINEGLNDEFMITCIGISNCLLAIFSLIANFFFVSVFDFSYIFMALFNGVMFYFCIKLMSLSYSHIDISMTTSFTYIMTVLIFALGAIFLHEPIFFTDVVGSLLILGFNVYHVRTPIVQNPE